jgi:5-methyltetrahydrofolate--homocysteine methyltransferase
MSIPGLHEHELLIVDGACGTNLQAMDIPASAWQGKDGCNEWLNVTAPWAIESLHQSFVEAGAQIIETNTFGATRIVLAEYGLEGEVARINAAAVAHARRAASGRPGVFVAGSIGPTTKLVSLGHISRDDLYAAYVEQVRSLLDSGVDALMVETCQDLLQVKTAVMACFETMTMIGRNVPLMVSVTVERTGTLLVGTDIAAAAATLAPFPIFSFGLNCATGPADMTSHIRHLSHTWPARISCIPNQGLPEVVGGETVYPLSPDDYARQMRPFVEEYGVSIVGGCCGTTPAHTRRLVEVLRGVKPACRQPQLPPTVTSLYQAIELRQEIPPLLIGEKTNANGSKKFRERLLADDYAGCLQIGTEQEAGGAHVLDLCAAYAGRDETLDMLELVRLFAPSIKIPLMIDSTTPDCIEACLKRYPGRCIVNSINLEDGGVTLRRVCRLVKDYGAAVVALTINEQGMAMTARDKIETARRIHDIAVGEFGLSPSDLLFDALTFTVGSGDATLRDAALQTLEAIRGIKQALPGVGTVLGVSNISFGLSPASRRILNSVFLHEAVEAGLDAAIIDAAKVLPLAKVAAVDREICSDLLHDHEREPGKAPLLRFIEHFRDAGSEKAAGQPAAESRTAEQVLFDMVVDGRKEGVDDQLTILLSRFAPLAIINQILVPAMRHVGELFGRGEILLPFVLQSAEVMKHTVSSLEPLLDKAAARHATKVVLATVQGDVHDIGKNLVDIILSNNGYEVHNLGIKVPAETIIQKAREVGADLIGLSGLLVKSAIVMKESLPQYRAAGLTCPILLGGAALTPRYVAETCVPAYGGPVVYCSDAFAGLKAAREFEEGRLTSTVYEARGAVGALKPGPKNVEISRDVPVPVPPFTGLRHVVDIDPRVIFPLINEQALFRGRWGYRRGKMAAAEYDALIAGKVRPLFEEFMRAAGDEGLIRPKVAYGYFPCHSEGNALVVRDHDQIHRFPFPRQSEAPFLCIADFFRTEAEGGDLAAFYVVTIGDAIGIRTHEWFAANRYHDYMMLHGFSVEVTDALAEYWHQVMRREMGIATNEPSTLGGYVTQAYRGSRYGFGYPACPDLEAHKPLFALLHPESIGVTLTETMEMVPEQSTSAIVAHHPQAKYFSV